MDPQTQAWMDLLDRIRKMNAEIAAIMSQPKPSEL